MKTEDQKTAIVGRREMILIPGSENRLIKFKGNYHLVNKNGEPISMEFNSITKFKNGLAVFTRGNKKNVVTSDGTVLFKRYYDNIVLDRGVIRICSDDKWGLATKQGQIVCSTSYPFIESFNARHARFKTVDGKWGIIDSKGRILVAPKYYFLSSPEKQKIIAKNYRGYGVIDVYGEVVEPFRYKRIKFVEQDVIIYNSEQDKYLV